MDLAFRRTGDAVLRRKETFDFRPGMIAINLDLKRGGNDRLLNKMHSLDVGLGGGVVEWDDRKALVAAGEGKPEAGRSHWAGGSCSGDLAGGADLLYEEDWPLDLLIAMTGTELLRQGMNCTEC